MMNRKMMMMAAVVVVVLVVMMYMSGKKDNLVTTFTRFPSGIVAEAVGVKKRPWENPDDSFKKVVKAHGTGMYVAHETPCSVRDWGRNGEEVCRDYFKGKAPIHFTQRVCKRGFLVGGEASYLCLSRPMPMPKKAAAVSPPTSPKAKVVRGVHPELHKKLLLEHTKKFMSKIDKLKHKVEECEEDVLRGHKKSKHVINKLQTELKKANDLIQDLEDDIEHLEGGE